MKKLILTPLLLVAPLAAQAGLGLSPMRVELKMQPGQTYSGALQLTNELGARLRLRGELLDFTLDATMTPQFARRLEGEANWTCRDWLTVNPMETETSDGERIFARYTLRVPAAAAPRSYYCAVGFTALPPAAEMKNIGIRTTVRVLAAFYVTVGDATPHGAISGLTLEPRGDGWQAVLKLNNDSDFHFRPDGALEALDASGAVLAKAAVPSFPTLPRREQRYLVPFEAPRAALAALRVRVDLGGAEVLEASVPVPPRPVP
jgi:hypothetical protein